MGWYPCCCDREGCSPCDCFPCGLRFKLNGIPSFVCSSSYLTDNVFLGEWVYANVTQNTPGSCVAEYIAYVDTQPDITVPPGPTAYPPYTCGTCVVSPNIMRVRFVITIYPQANCGVPCNDSDFGGSSVCQYCDWHYDFKIYVEPLIAGNASQDNEQWNSDASQTIDPETCDDYISAATSSGNPVCPVGASTTHYFHLGNSELCSSGNPILDFRYTASTIEPVEEYRNSLGVDCDGDPGCACWWQFNPVSPQTAPCTPTTDSSFVNCMDVTFGSGWHDTNWEEDGTVPDDGDHWRGGITCSDMDTALLKSTNDASGDFVPCYWVETFGSNPTTIFMRLGVVQASDVQLGNPSSCWDLDGYSCTSINSWLQEDVSLATFSNYKFRLIVEEDWVFDPTDPLRRGRRAKYEWLSQNSFTLSDIWGSGAIAANPLKPFQAVATQNYKPDYTGCSSFNFTSAACIFTPYSSISFPTTYAEEMHCKSLHNIPDVTISPHTPTNC